MNDQDVLDAQRTVLTAETQLVQTERTRLADMLSFFNALECGWGSETPNEQKAVGTPPPTS